MTPAAHTNVFERQLSADQLHDALKQARTVTLQFLQQWRALTGDSRANLPLHSEWNPPEWEAGHIAWFQEFWIARNPDRSLGWEADPNQARFSSVMKDSDALYHSSLIAHDPRWRLPLPTPEQLQGYLDAVLAETLKQLADASRYADHGDLNRALYFFRLALYHENMHAEAAIYSMNHYLHDTQHSIDTVNLHFDVLKHAIQASPLHAAANRTSLNINAGNRTFGAHTSIGFAFDNELPLFTQSIPSFSIDSQAVSVADYLAFIEAGGYQDQTHWSEEGWNWKTRTQAVLPRFHRLHAGHLERCCFGEWVEMSPASPIVHISAHEAEAWCVWAGRRLPTEHEWTSAAVAYPEAFLWGRVWEWTQSDFLPFDGFVPHPYVDYSVPWFAGHRVLKGASFATHAGMHNPVYRNFYVPSRNDIYAGFRTCAR